MTHYCLLLANAFILLPFAPMLKLIYLCSNLVAINGTLCSPWKSRRWSKSKASELQNHKIYIKNSKVKSWTTHFDRELFSWPGGTGPDPCRFYSFQLIQMQFSMSTTKHNNVSFLREMLWKIKNFRQNCLSSYKGGLLNLFVKMIKLTPHNNNF